MKKNNNQRKIPTQIEGFKIPSWWECQWRRIPCAKNECTFCGRLEKLENLMSQSEYEEDLEELEEKTYDDLRQVVRYQAKDMGIPEEYLMGGYKEDDDDFYYEDYDPKEKPLDPKKFLIYRIVERWSRPLVYVIGKAEEKKYFWTKKEEIKDLVWYSSMLGSKVYRQLSTKREERESLDKNNKFNSSIIKIEISYNGYVLREMIRIVEDSIEKICKNKKIPHQEEFREVSKRFKKIKPLILDIAQP